MTEPENPLSRWSRLKHETVSKGQADAGHDDPRIGSGEPATTEPEARLNERLTDPQDLPPIDAITFDTDIRAFLKSRVPAELTRAALRRAWLSDPAIRDFVGIAENQWDFNDPTTIPGFGPLQGNDNISVLLRQAFGQPAEFVDVIAELPIAEEPVTPEMVSEIGAPDQADSPGAWNTATVERAEIEPGAEQNSEAPPKRRTHGGALPR
jgi:Protein of unknown function (DUF3306)